MNYEKKHMKKKIPTHRDVTEVETTTLTQQARFDYIHKRQQSSQQEEANALYGYCTLYV